MNQAFARPALLPAHAALAELAASLRDGGRPLPAHVRDTVTLDDPGR